MRTNQRFPYQKSLNKREDAPTSASPFLITLPYSSITLPYSSITLPYCHTSDALACFTPLLVETRDAVGGFVTFGVNDGSVDGGGFDVAMTEQFGNSVEVGSCHKCHRRVAVTGSVEGDVFVDAGALHPLCNHFLDSGCGWQVEDGMVGMSFEGGEPSEGIIVELVGDGFLCFLHDDGEPVVIAYLVDVPPSDISDVTKSEPSEAAEEKGLLDHLIEA